MTAAPLFTQRLGSVRAASIAAWTVAGVIFLGCFAQSPAAYFFVAVPAAIPLFIWLRAGAFGIPTFAVLSGVYFIYYAIPLLRENIEMFSSEELFTASLTVGSFLIAASAVYWCFLHVPAKSADESSRNFVSTSQIVRLIFVGLAAGIVFHLAVLSNNLDWIGGASGAVRSAALTLASVSCYMLGCARGSRLLVGTRWALAAGGLVCLILMSLASLLLVGGVMYGLAAVLGYVISSKRVPWLGLGIAVILLSVLHAGKYEIRNRYWAPHSQSSEQMSAVQIPGMIFDWFWAGIESLGSDQKGPDILERASLLHMLLLVQRVTPGFIPYLEGETYALLPSMLVPRFIDSGKVESQAGLNMLSVRYGLQPVEATASTTIGWGLVAEAFANFGYLGVLAIGALFGGFCGTLTRLSAGAAPLSLSVLVTIAATLTLFNVELDLSYLVTTLAQSVVAIVAVGMLFRLANRRSSVAATASPRALLADGHPLGDAASR